MKTYLISLFQIDTINSLFSGSMILDFEWHDDRLKWDPEFFSNVSEVSIGAGSLWIPDLYLSEFTDVNANTFIKEKTVRVRHDGHCHQAQSFSFQIPKNFDMVN